MATITLTLTAVCAGGGHYTLALSGDVSYQHIYRADEIKDMVTSVGPDEVIAAILRIADAGRTPAQVKSLLQTGITVTI